MSIRPTKRMRGEGPRSRRHVRRGLALAAALFVLGPASGLYGLDPRADPAHYIATLWDTESGMPHNGVRALLQTRDGYLWVGTRFGLARFDGLQFTIFNQSNTPSLPNNYITSMAESPDGSLWLGTAGGLARYVDGTFTAYYQKDGLKFETVNDVCTAADGSLWVAGRGGIVRWVDGAFVDDIDMSAYDTYAMRSLYADSRGAVWVVMGAQALRYQDGRFTAYGPGQGITAERVERVVEDSAGHLLALTPEGILRLEGDRFVSYEAAGLSSDRISTALADQDGNLWIGSVSGLDRCREGAAVPYRDRYGAGLETTDALLEDREGCLWVGTSSGLYRIIDRRAQNLDIGAEASSGYITTVSQTRDGSQWIGMWAHGVMRITADGATHLVKGAPLSHETVAEVHATPDGVMWFGTRGSSVDRWDGDTLTTYVYASGVPTSRPVTAFLTDDDGTLLLGIHNRGLLELREGEIVTVPETVDLGRFTVWTLHRTGDGDLWMATSQGVYRRADDRTWEPIEFPGLRKPVIVHRILEEPDGSLWLGTETHGLVRWSGGRAQAYGTAQGMLDDYILGVVDDGLGSIWVSAARGIARYRRSEFAAFDRGEISTLDGMRIGRVDGLASACATGTGGNSACRLADGRLLFATDKGAAVIDPRAVETNTLPPPVVVEQIIVDEQPVPARGKVTLPPGSSKLEIKYTALSLIAPQNLRFRYQLEGSDRRWVEAGFDRSARYTHLSPGDYTFRVLACNNDGVWSEVETNLAITLAPFFYQTWWFRSTLALALAGAVGLLVWLRLRQLRRREAELTHMNIELDRRVQKRTAELSASHGELEHREQLFRLIFEHAPVGISWMRADLGPNCHFNSTFRRILDLPARVASGDLLFAGMVHPDDASKYAAMSDSIRSGKADSFILEQRFVRKDGALVWGLLSVAVIRDDQGNIIQEIGIMEDISARKQAEAELVETNRDMIDLSRQAGMAEVATGVLHNVGNVLNSINVSATIVAESVGKLEVNNLARVGSLLRQHDGDLGTFFSTDPKAAQIPKFIEALAEHMTTGRSTVLRELEDLRKNVEHIKDIVAMQQSYAKVCGVAEEIPVTELVDDALRLNAGALSRHEVNLIREFHTAQVVEVEKHKVLQILVNLIRNAKYACDDSGRGDKRLLVRIEDDRENVKISVIDNGVGIPAENLTRIFSHGFTTRKEGHGFGLHSGALAAKELGGALTAASEGPGRGATFTLTLPVRAVGERAA